MAQFIKNASTGGFLAVNAAQGPTTNGAQLIQFAFTGDGTQQWDLEQQASGAFLIKNVGSGKVIDVPHSSLNAGTQLIQFNEDGGQNQLWTMISVAGVPGGVVFQNVATGLFINAAGNNGNNGDPIIEWPNFPGGVQLNSVWIPSS